MSKCTHAHTTAGRHYGFSGSVARYPYTDENRAAHGGITYTETCDRCRATRSVNQNGGHSEYSPWRPAEQPGTVQSAIADDIDGLLALSRPERTRLLVEARRLSISNRRLASATGFWRRLSADHVLQALS